MVKFGALFGIPFTRLHLGRHLSKTEPAISLTTPHLPRHIPLLFWIAPFFGRAMGFSEVRGKLGLRLGPQTTLIHRAKTTSNPATPVFGATTPCLQGYFEGPGRLPSLDSLAWVSSGLNAIDLSSTRVMGEGVEGVLPLPSLPPGENKSSKMDQPRNRQVALSLFSVTVAIGFWG